MNYDSLNETVSKLDRVLDEIRLFVRQGLSADPILVRDVAAEFGEACAYTNQRLHKTIRLLRQGLTSEAIQSADQSPAVLTLTSQLSFPESDQWNSLLYQLNLEQPPAVLLEFADEFEAAKENYLRLQTLMDQHRLFALARAPLASRILILRKILRREPDNPAWTSDLKAWETQRLSQIPAELSNAAQNHDHGKLLELESEIESRWILEPPNDLVQQLRKELANENARRSKSRMAAAAAQLSDARAAGDVESAAQAHEQLQKMGELVRDATVASPQASPDDVHWLENQRHEANVDIEFAAEVASVKRLIAYEANPDVVQERLGALELHLRPVPPELYERANRYFRSYSRRRRNKLMLRVAGIVLGIAVLVLGVSSIVKTVAHRRTINAAINAVQAMIEAQEYENALQLLDSSPQLAGNEKAIACRQEIQNILVDVRSWDMKHDKFRGELGRLTAIQVNDLIGTVVTKKQHKRAINLENDWKEITNQEHPKITAWAVEVEKSMLQLPESATNLKSIEEELGLLVSRTAQNLDGERRLTQNQLIKANDILALIQNGLVASNTDPVPDFEAYSTALEVLGKDPVSSRMANDLTSSIGEKRLWATYNESQLLASTLTAEAFADMTTDNLKKHLPQLEAIRTSAVQIGDKQILEKLVAQIEKQILSRQAYFGTRRNDAWNDVEQAITQITSRGQRPGGAPGNSPRSSRQRQGTSGLIETSKLLKQILTNSDDATLESTYIKLVDCLLANRSELESVDNHELLVTTINTSFQVESISVRESLKKHLSSEATDRLVSNDQWREIREDILADLSERLNLTKWRETFDYQCIGWIYQVPVSGKTEDLSIPLRFTLVGNQKEHDNKELFCLVPMGDVNSMRVVGHLKGGMILASQNGPRLQAGRPVFIKKKIN